MALSKDNVIDSVVGYTSTQWTLAKQAFDEINMHMLSGDSFERASDRFAASRLLPENVVSDAYDLYAFVDDAKRNGNDSLDLFISFNLATDEEPDRYFGDMAMEDYRAAFFDEAGLNGSDVKRALERAFESPEISGYNGQLSKSEQKGLKLLVDNFYRRWEMYDLDPTCAYAPIRTGHPDFPEIEVVVQSDRNLFDRGAGEPNFVELGYKVIPSAEFYDAHIGEDVCFTRDDVTLVDILHDLSDMDSVIEARFGKQEDKSPIFVDDYDKSSSGVSFDF